MADNGFKSGFANALQSMMEEKLPRCGIKACPHITSRIKILKKLWQTAYDMVYGPNTSGFAWDPDTKCVTVDKDVWDENIKANDKRSLSATVSQKRKEPPQVDPNSAAPPKNKKQKAEQVKQGKKKVVVSESCSSDDKGWKQMPSANGSSDTSHSRQEQDLVSS
ncbi:hypothetical protein K1719_020423 [Acacia pycnantha]|nr:hypothetical protein K1719_020423 [Acacia pycnantha]